MTNPKQVEGPDDAMRVRMLKALTNALNHGGIVCIAAYEEPYRGGETVMRVQRFAYRTSPVVMREFLMCAIDLCERTHELAALSEAMGGVPMRVILDRGKQG